MDFVKYIKIKLCWKEKRNRKRKVKGKVWRIESLRKFLNKGLLDLVRFREYIEMINIVIYVDLERIVNVNFKVIILFIM